jgi:hypothetical protein
MQVAYRSEQSGFQQHKQHFYSPHFQQFPGLQHAATIARTAFQAAAKVWSNVGPLRVYSTNGLPNKYAGTYK